MDLLLFVEHLQEHHLVLILLLLVKHLHEHHLVLISLLPVEHHHELPLELTLQLLVQLIILLSFILSSFSSPVQLIFQHPERAATIIGETTPSRHFSTSYHHRSYLHTNNNNNQFSPLQIIKIHQILNIPNLICLFVKYFNI